MLKRLQYVFLWHNRLTGIIPATLANCSLLQDLELSQNQLSGQITLDIGMLSRLEVLFIWGNSFTGNIPVTLLNCSALTVLVLTQNQLSGQIPLEIGMLNRLQKVYLSDNRWTGVIPVSLANCSAMQMLTLAGNELSGIIPPELGMLSILEGLNLNRNRLTGEVPNTLANCTALQGIELSVNELSGSLNILKELSNVTTIFQRLVLSFNNFHGEIPDVFGRYTGLVWLHIQHNFVTGPLPRSLAQLKNLVTVVLSENRFQGSIPDPLLTSLELLNVDLSRNNLSGAIPQSLGPLYGLIALNLSHNALTGRVPDLCDTTVQLEHLNLSNNMLSGNIPPSLSKCSWLISLDMSRNQLNGNLPRNLEKLGSLIRLDLSENKLRGRVPNSAPYNNTSVTNLTGNPGLCGPIVHRICDSSPQETHSNQKRKFAAIAGEMVALVALLVLGAVWLCRRYYMNLKRLGTLLQMPNMDRAGRLLNVTAEELSEATGCLSEENVVGKASVGTVYGAILPGGKLEVAAKVLDKEKATEAEAEASFKREVEMLAKVKHRNIVRVIGCCFKVEMKTIILELVSNGSLDKYLQGRHLLSGEQKLKILHGVVLGLEYLHHYHPEGSIVHSDIKPWNVLLDADLEARIATLALQSC